MSRRVGLRFVSVEGFLKRVKHRLAELIIYILRRRFIARVFYYPKPYDKGRYAEVTRISITLQEVTIASDFINSTSADRISQSFQESSSSSDTYSMSEAVRQTVSLGETVSLSDSSEQPQAQRVVSSLQESTSPSDVLSHTQALRVISSGLESSHSSDMLSLTTAYKYIVSRRERTKTYESSVISTPYPEDPSKTLFEMANFEVLKTLDELLWYYYINGNKVGGYTDPSGTSYSYEMKTLADQVSESDSTTYNAYTQWIQATLYRGYDPTMPIYTVAKTIYLGYDPTPIYTVAKTIYLGYAQTSVASS